jgi:predicted TIM-barrel fold metal-dependent hydrolase
MGLLITDTEVEGRQAPVGGLEDLVGLMTPDHILFGSDYPHPEGMTDPLHWAKVVSDLVLPSKR